MGNSQCCKRKSLIPKELMQHSGDSNSSEEKIRLNKVSRHLKKKLQTLKSKDVFLQKQWFIEQQAQDINQVYNLNAAEILGEGQFGIVYKAINIHSKQVRAIKKIIKMNIEDPSEFLNEIDIMKTLDHPNVVKLYETYEDDNNVYLVMELCEGGELFNKIIKNKFIEENEARIYFKQMVAAVYYCHTKGICHRDLKPENILMLNDQPNSPIKIADFGISCMFINKDIQQDQQKKITMRQQAGTSYYMSPEVINYEYNEQCDVWSLGVILYVMLSGTTPFTGSNDEEVFQKIQKGKFHFNSQHFSNVDKSVQDLIKKCICPVDKRIDIGQILSHPWMLKNEVQIKEQLNIDQFRNFYQQHKFKKIVLSYIASQLDEKEIRQITSLFRQLDKNGDGVLSLSEIKQAMQNLDEKQSQELTQILKSIDMDGSGNIDYTEFIAAYMAEDIYQKDEYIKMAFKKFDLDNSGEIEISELKKILLSDEYQDIQENYWLSLFQKVDLNNDGKISYEEFEKMMKEN